MNSLVRRNRDGQQRAWLLTISLDHQQQLASKQKIPDFSINMSSVTALALYLKLLADGGSAVGVGVGNERLVLS